jgi:N-acetylmuramoyl-L-alanine amidase
VVLHYTAMTDAAAAERALCDPAREVSCHWLIARDGTVTALVDEERRAWHAGAGSWGAARRREFPLHRDRARQ